MVDGTPFGRYRLIELLGRGGMGEVWRAYDPDMNRVVALKVLPPNLTGDQIFQERFRREARSAAGLDEPHVVGVCRSYEVRYPASGLAVLRLSPFLEKGDPAIHVDSRNRRTKVGIFAKEGIVNGPLD